MNDKFRQGYEQGIDHKKLYIFLNIFIRTLYLRLSHYHMRNKFVRAYYNLS